MITGYDGDHCHIMVCPAKDSYQQWCGSSYLASQAIFTKFSELAGTTGSG